MTMRGVVSTAAAFGRVIEVVLDTAVYVVIAALYVGFPTACAWIFFGLLIPNACSADSPWRSALGSVVACALLAPHLMRFVMTGFVAVYAVCSLANRCITDDAEY